MKDYTEGWFSLCLRENDQRKKYSSYFYVAEDLNLITSTGLEVEVLEVTSMSNRIRVIFESFMEAFCAVLQK